LPIITQFYVIAFFKPVHKHDYAVAVVQAHIEFSKIAFPNLVSLAANMKIREYTPLDLEVLKMIHVRQSFDYKFPDLANPLFVSKLVLEDGEGGIAMASLARLTCEIYLLTDPFHSSPRERLKNLITLHLAAQGDLAQRGLEDAHAWLPPKIARRFGRRLTKLGWTRDDKWTPFSIRLLSC
jgi:hypothetical protein